MFSFGLNSFLNLSTTFLLNVSNGFYFFIKTRFNVFILGVNIFCISAKVTILTKQ